MKSCLKIKIKNYLCSGWGAMTLLIWGLVIAFILGTSSSMVGIEKAVTSFLPMIPLAVMGTCLITVLYEIDPFGKNQEKQT